MAQPSANLAPRVTNRRALHDYFIESKLECGIALMGSEVKSLRLGRCQLNDSFARVENGRLILHHCHIDPYDRAGKYNHEPLRERALLAHGREIRKLQSEAERRGVTLIPLAIYFRNGYAKVEIGVARGKQEHDKRAKIREQQQKRDLQRLMMRRG